jgi:hypothetical protein
MRSKVSKDQSSELDQTVREIERCVASFGKALKLEKKASLDIKAICEKHKLALGDLLDSKVDHELLTGYPQALVFIVIVIVIVIVILFYSALLMQFSLQPWMLSSYVGWSMRY